MWDGSLIRASYVKGILFDKRTLSSALIIMTAYGFFKE